MASPKSPRDRQKTRIKDLDEKWKMLFNEKPRPPLYSVDKYIEYLRKFTSPSLDESFNSKGSLRSNSSGVSNNSEQQIAYLLKKLKLDLKMSYERFLETFICSPNNGLNLLLTLLKNIQKISRDNTKGSVKEKMQSKKRQMSEELECILCIKFCLRVKESVKILLEVPYGLENVAEALLSSNFRSRCTALEVMSKVLMEDEGFHRNLECFTYFRLKNCEPVRFKFLINMLMSAGSSSVQISFQLCCMKFLNSLLTSSPDGNTRIFLQSEIEMAGLDVKALLTSVDMKISEDKDEIKKEIIDYRNSLLDVDQLLESHETLYKLNIELHQKVFFLQEQLHMAKRLQQVGLDAETTSNFIPSLVDPEHESLKGLVELDKLLDSFESDSNSSLQDTSEHFDQSVDSQITGKPMVRQGSNRNWKKAGHQLPILKRKPKENVLPLSYKHIDPDALPMNEDHNHILDTESLSSVQTTITFIEPSRTDTFLEVQKEIGLPVEVIVECLQNYDMEDLTVDNIKALLNLLPTENEMRNILTLDCELENLGEAEQFLVQIMSVERLEERIKIMLFLDQFTNTGQTIFDEMMKMKSCLSSLMMCDRFRRFVELTKNYMVENFYSTPLDFKLSLLFKLEKIVNATTSDNPLQEIAVFIQRYHPDVLHWFQDLTLETDSRVSFKRFSTFINETKDGIKLMESELTKAPDEELNKLYQSLCERFNSVYEQFQDLDKMFDETCALFRETKDATEPYELLYNVIHLSEQFKNVVENLPPVQNMNEPVPDYTSEHENETDNNMNENDCSEESSQELTSSELDSFGLNVTALYDDRERIKNWIVMTSPTNFVNTDVISEKYCEQVYPSKTKDKDKWYNYTKQDSDSGDSAFEGSGGRCLKKHVIQEKLEVVGQRSSTPISPLISNEPAPDYSRSNSPDPDDTPLDDIGSEVSRILREFEGDLNGYETHITTPVNRRFYTIHSIINL